MPFQLGVNVHSAYDRTGEGQLGSKEESLHLPWLI